MAVPNPKPEFRPFEPFPIRCRGVISGAHGFTPAGLEEVDAIININTDTGKSDVSCVRKRGMSTKCLAYREVPGDPPPSAADCPYVR